MYGLVYEDLNRAAAACACMTGLRLHVSAWSDVPVHSASLIHSFIEIEVYYSLPRNFSRIIPHTIVV